MKEAKFTRKNPAGPQLVYRLNNGSELSCVLTGQNWEVVLWDRDDMLFVDRQVHPFDLGDTVRPVLERYGETWPPQWNE
jgi:hypothetical protein